MKGRRDFLKGALAMAGAAMAGKGVQIEAAGLFPAGLINTKTTPGRWAGKEGAHLPRVTLEGRSLTVVTPHPMTKEHFIVKHTLLSLEGSVIGEKSFFYTDPAAESTYVLPAGMKGPIWVTSFCNIHDLWLTEFAV